MPNNISQTSKGQAETRIIPIVLLINNIYKKMFNKMLTKLTLESLSH